VIAIPDAVNNPPAPPAPELPPEFAVPEEPPPATTKYSIVRPEGQLEVVANVPLELNVCTLNPVMSVTTPPVA
jgi:hypothetical protein